MEKEIRITPWHDVFIVVGTLNGRVGKDNTGRERAMGTQCLGCINNNGERRCAENNVVIV